MIAIQTGQPRIVFIDGAAAEHYALARRFLHQFFAR
jgi:hypothetical protein